LGEDKKRRRILLLLSKSTEVKNSQLLPFDDDYDDDDNKKMTAIISSPRELENVNEIEAPGMKQITTRTQSQMTRQLEGDDSSSNGGGRSRKHKKNPKFSIHLPTSSVKHVIVMTRHLLYILFKFSSSVISANTPRSDRNGNSHVVALVRCSAH
jgi:hypothetical protein